MTRPETERALNAVASGLTAVIAMTLLLGFTAAVGGHFDFAVFPILAMFWWAVAAYRKQPDEKR